MPLVTLKGGRQRLSLDDVEVANLMGGHPAPPIGTAAHDSYYRIAWDRIVEAYGEDRAEDLVLLGTGPDDLISWTRRVAAGLAEF